MLTEPKRGIKGIGGGWGGEESRESLLDLK